MVEKIGPIKNPLTIIAIFAGIAEVSGTVILPFIDISNQTIFVWFLILFPSILVIIFFITLNWNHKVLYAPSDYQDEENFVKTISFDFSKLKKEEILESTEEIIKKMQYEISIANFKDSEKLIKHLKSHNFLASLYLTPREIVNQQVNLEDHKAIWLWGNVPVNIAVPVIKIAKQFYPHIVYIHLSSEEPSQEGAPDYIHNQIFIGGATSTAIEYNLKEISKENFSRLDEKMSQTEFHKFIKAIS